MSKIVKGVGKAVGSMVGLSGGADEAAKYNADPMAYSDLYQKALDEIQKAGTDPASQQSRKSIQDALNSQLADLEGNAAGREANFLEDMARGFQADTQSIARAKGGTGTLAQAMRMPGSMYDSQSRATARGLNDLYSQATDDLSQLQGVQGNLFGQDMGRATNLANLNMQELGSRRGTNVQNLDNQWNAQQAMYDRFRDTVKQGASYATGKTKNPTAGGAT